MSSIERWKGGKWRARFRTPDGRGRSRVFPRKEDAVAYLASIEHAKRMGAYVDPAAGRVLFQEYAERWHAVQAQHRPTTVVHEETMLRRHVYPFLGARPMGAILPSEIQGRVAGRCSVLAPSTVEFVYRLVVRIFRAACRDRLLAAHPCIDIRLPRPDRARVVPLTVDEFRALEAAMPSRLQALVLVGAAAGLRQGEALGLTADRVDFLRRTITVDRQLLLLPGRAPEFAPPKTRTSRRTIPVPQLVVDVLAGHLAEHGEGPDRLVFTAGDGSAIRRNRFSDTWRRAVVVAGVRQGVTFHDLRHFYASLLIRHGESVKTVQARLGHATAQETLDTYGHLWPDSEDRTRAAVEMALAPIVAGTPADGSGQ